MSKIPNIISFYWQGRMSWLRWLTLASFRVFHPNWKIYLCQPTHEEDIQRGRWEEDIAADEEYAGFDWRERLDDLGIIHETSGDWMGMPPAYACDLYQWKTLASRGGWYADMDILWRRSLDNLTTTRGEKANTQDVIFCVERGFMAIGFFGTSPGNLLFQDVYQEAQRTDESYVGYQKYGVEVLYRLAGTGKYHTTNQGAHKTIARFMDKYTPLCIARVPDETVYPFDWRETHKIFRWDCKLPDNCYGIHWFGGSGTARGPKTTLTPNNVTHQITTLTRTILEVLPPKARITNYD